MRMYSALDAGEGVMAVYGFFAFHFYAEPGDGRVCFEFCRHVADHIFHEKGIIVGLFRDEFFVRPFEEGIYGGGAGSLGNVYEALQPFEAAHAQGKAYRGALTMRAGPTDGLGAGADRGNWNIQFEQETRAFLPGFKFSGEAAGIAHGGGMPGDRRLADAEIGKAETGIGPAGMQAAQNIGEQALMEA